MVRFIGVTFVFLGFVFYYLSGGAEFQPEVRTVAAAADPSANSKEFVARSEPLRDVKPKVQTAQEEDAEKLGFDPVRIETAAAIDTQGRFFRVVNQKPKAAVAVVEQPVKTVPDDIRQVRVARANMRNGPGTSFGVVAKLTQGERVTVLRDPGSGWVKLRVIDSAQVGWTADSLLASASED